MTVDSMRWIRLEGARVLVVDDEPQAVQSLDRVLTQVGAQVHTAMSLTSALEVLARGQFDAAVVDFYLVGQEGKALMQPLREQLVSTLMISGVERVNVANQAISSGADEFMLKPFEVDEFLDTVCGLVDKTRHWRERLAQIGLGLKPEKRERANNSVDQQIDDVVEVLAGHAGWTEREKRVMRMVVASLTNKQMSEELGVSLSTVKYHDRRARLKLGVDSRDELRQLVWRMLRGQNG